MLLFILACTGKSQRSVIPKFDEEEIPSYIQTITLENGDYIQEIDLDQNGKTDVWNSYHPRGEKLPPLLMQKVVDVNGDGIGDTWSFYGDDGLLEEEHFDMDHDQHAERKEYYKDGVCVSRLIDHNGDNIPEVVIQIRNGVLYRIKKDTTGDTQKDLWQALDKSGHVDKYVQDKDGDGILEHRVE